MSRELRRLVSHVLTHWPLGDCDEIYIEWCMYSSGELFLRSREGYFGVYFPSCEATMETNTKGTLEWAQKQFVTRVHTLFNFLHGMRIHKWRRKRRSSHIDTSSHIALIIFCIWWRHNLLLMTSQSPDNCDSSIWKVISSSLDTDFIHVDIHDRSCKNIWITCKLISVTDSWSTPCELNVARFC